MMIFGVSFAIFSTYFGKTHWGFFLIWLENSSMPNSYFNPISIAKWILSPFTLTN